MVVMDLDRPLEAAPSFGEWRPLAGAALLDRLRITGRPRPKADPLFGQELRQGLEEAMVAELRRVFTPSIDWNVIDAEWLKPEEKLYVFDLLKRDGETFQTMEVTEFKVLDKVAPETFSEPK